MVLVSPCRNLAGLQGPHGYSFYTLSTRQVHPGMLPYAFPRLVLKVETSPGWWIPTRANKLQPVTPKEAWTFTSVACCPPYLTATSAHPLTSINSEYVVTVADLSDTSVGRSALRKLLCQCIRVSLTKLGWHTQLHPPNFRLTFLLTRLQEAIMKSSRHRTGSRSALHKSYCYRIY